MNATSHSARSGILFALASTILFGASTPLAKALLGDMAPWLLAGLLYLGSGLGLFGVGRLHRWLADASPEAPLHFRDLPWLAAIVVSGGIAGPLLLMVGGLVAGTVNVGIALALEPHWPRLWAIAAAGVVGFLGYGVSLTCFVLALRHLGTARTSAYFSLAPFVGALVSIVALGEPVTSVFLAASALMAMGLYLHLAERRAHEHVHE